MKLISARGSPQRINESPWARCLQGAVDAVDARVFVVVVLLLSSPSWGGADGQIVLWRAARLFFTNEAPRAPLELSLGLLTTQFQLFIDSTWL